MITLTVRAGHDGRLTALDPAAACLGCGCEPEVVEYLTRTYRRPGGEPVKVRVGYRCRCGAVVCDGLYEGSSPPMRGDL